jgi:hypothetical protein
MGTTEGVEVGIALRELQWRLNEFERQLLVCSERFEPGEARRLLELIDRT